MMGRLALAYAVVLAACDSSPSGGSGGAGGSGGSSGIRDAADSDVIIPDAQSAVDANAGAPCSPSNYVAYSNAQPMPYDFCAYTGSPFRTKLPASPASIDSVATAILQNVYLPNSTLPTDNDETRDLSVSYRYPPSPCCGNDNYPVYKASSSDPLVRFECGATAYGCWRGTANGVEPVSTVPAMRFPAAARPSLSSDNNIEVIQPDGTTISIYWCCGVTFSDFVDGEVIGAAGQPHTTGLRGITYSNIVTANGLSGGINAGDDFAALPVHYNEVANGQIHHALGLWFGCFTGTVYPLGGATECSGGGGLPSGVHLWLALTHAQIDAMSTAIIPAHMRVFMYAAHDYGIFVGDSAGPPTKSINGSIFLEDPLPQLIFNNNTNPWDSWFTAHGGYASNGNWRTHQVVDWAQLAPYFHVLDQCYARGTCADSLPPDP